jgi:hypothetical protein
MTVASALSLLSDETLEDLWCRYQVTAQHDLQEDVFAVLLNRPDFCPQDYDLLWELQDAGWNGGCTQEDRDSR